jgi:O-antigen/teichoic acid export membrane protein
MATPVASRRGAVRRATRKARDEFVLWTIVKTVAALIVLFVLVGIAIPDLVDAHDTALLVLAIAIACAAIGIAVVTIVSIQRGYRRLQRGVIHLIEADK